jgi:hypothetical protein
MILKINKNYFKNLANGEHNLKVYFKDGHAEGTFEVKNKISFSILGTTFTATEGMTWVDWIISCGVSNVDNSIVSIVNNKIHLYPNYKPEWNNSSAPNVSDIENALYQNGETLQYANSIIVNGGVYGREDGAPA